MTFEGGGWGGSIKKEQNTLQVHLLKKHSGTHNCQKKVHTRSVSGKKHVIWRKDAMHILVPINNFLVMRGLKHQFAKDH